VLLWALALLAQHYDRLGEHATALQTINDAITHTPTAVELYLFKAKILKACCA
jgi:peptide alpha-N-acetyltransferase